MRHILNLFLVIGGTAAGLVLGAGLAFRMGILVFSPGRDDWGAYPLFVFLAACGGVVGAFAGFVGSKRWTSRRSGEPFTFVTWIGMAIGLVAGVAIQASGILETSVVGDVIEWLPGKLAFWAATAFLGAVTGTLAAAWGKRKVRATSERLDEWEVDPRSTQQKKHKSKLGKGRHR